MLSVFIGYGGAEAEGVADCLNAFFRIWPIDSFCASPKSNQLPQGETAETIKQVIRKKIEESSIIVLVCHSESLESQPLIEEIQYICQRNLNKKVIVFSKCDDCIPTVAAGLWHPTHFAPEKPEESFSRLLNLVMGKHISLYGSPEIENIVQRA
jgi:hypothetical protein